MTEEEYKKYKEALLLFYGGGRFILNNRFLPGIPTLPDIQEYTITFTNLDYPDLPIDIPDPITDISGTVVTLPTMSGEYEDTYNYYTPESWSIGSFGEEIELSDNLIANLVFNVVPKVVTYTVSFENTTYPDFDVSIPDSIIVPEGDSITLPSVSGEYEDEEYTYTPLKWSIGEFGEVITPDSNLTADLVWNVEPIQTYNIIGGLISETESIDWLSLDVLGDIDVDNVNLYSDLYQFGTVCVDNIALTQDFYMLGKLMHDYDPAIEDASFVVYDTVEENIVSFYKQELVYSEIEGIVLNSPEIIIGVLQTVPNRSFFFTENGREETNNTVLLDTDIIPLYDESGNLITDADTIALYDNSQALSFMKEDGNMEQALDSDLLVDNGGELSLQLSSQTRSRTVEQEETITIESTFGANITIPEGYKVDSVLCSRGYAFATNAVLSDTVVDYELPGEKVYFDDTNTSLVGVQVKPALQITVINTLSQTVVATLSSKYGDTGSGPSSASASYVNSGGYFVKGTANYSNGKGPGVANAMQTFPVYFNLADSSGNWLYFCFRVPQTLWQFRNGTFTWLGDNTAMYDLAYWYNTRPVKINLSLKQVSREITAWSVQTERVFVLQFSNSEHPSLDIPMPSNETGHSGTVITLPTVTGEYTEEGMVYTPVAWDIGAFGDSYTLNNDVTAILQLSSRVALPTVYSYSGTQTESSVVPDASIDTGLTYDSGNLYLGETNDGHGNATRYGWEAEEDEPAPAYTEITLYMQSGSKRCQLSVSSSFTGNVDSERVYQLYTDEECTIPWIGYDYSNDYEVGHYVNGEWNRYRDSVSAMPSSTAIYGIGYILMDTGFLWLCCNDRSSTSVTITNIVVRVYPKGQQHYAAYMNYSSVYANYTLANAYSREGVYSPGGSSNRYIQTPHQFPKIRLQKVLGSAGNELTRSQSSTFQGADSTRFRLYNYGPSTVDVRVAIYTLEYPIVGHWLKSDGTNISTSSGVAYPLMNLGGDIVEIDDAFDYFPIALIQYNGSYATDTYSYLNNATMGAFDTSNPTRLCFKQVSGTLSLSYVQYYKKPKPIETTFGADVTIPAGYEVESVKCERLFVKASNVSFSSGNPVNFTFDGENEFCADTATSLVGTGVTPCLGIYALNSVTANPLSGYWLSYRPTAATSISIYSVSASNINSDGVFVKGTVRATNGDADNTLISNALNSYPTLFRYYDSTGTSVPYYFKIQSLLWQFQNGTFSWLGDTTDSSDLAYWYNTRAVQINLKPITT